MARFVEFTQQIQSGTRKVVINIEKIQLCVPSFNDPSKTIIIFGGLTPGSDDEITVTESINQIMIHKLCS